MKIGFGKLRKAEELPSFEVDDEAPTRELGVVLPRGKVVGREVLAAEERARAILARAEERAALIVREAEARAAELKLRAEAEGRADAAASLAAKALALHAREAESAERQLDRAVELARILAERLLGEELALAPERIVALAREALLQARGARKVTVVAHPEDAVRLEAALASFGSLSEVTRVVSDPRRPRHSLRLETDIGTLDADIAPQLERLALKLRETLGHGT